MFNLNEKITEMLQSLIHSNSCALATNNGSIVLMGRGSCGSTCSNQCDGGCRGTCTRSCQGRSR